MERLIKSEIYEENSFVCELSNNEPNNTENLHVDRIAKFLFNIPTVDEDGDLVVSRRNDQQYIEIEHSSESNLKLVGLQIWRGALLLSDFIIHLGDQLKHKTILELGSGVGMTSIIASKFASKVICTDVDLGNILQIIKSNFERNQNHIKSSYSIIGLDFFNDFNEKLIETIQDVSIILAADVIYDNDITDAFIKTLESLLKLPPKKEIYVALEKRYVFTMCDFDSVAPCYEHFLLKLSELMAQHSGWSSFQMDIDFPQYFKYDRVKHLVLWKISS